MSAMQQIVITAMERKREAEQINKSASAGLDPSTS